MENIIAGIYKLTSPSNKIYIGRSFNIKRRFREQRKRLHESFKGKPRSEETKRKISDSNKGKKLPQEQIAKILATKTRLGSHGSLSKKINQYDLENNFIKQWNSAKDIVFYYCCSKYMIRNACRKNKKYINYFWKYN